MSHFSLVDQIDNIKGKLTDKEYLDLMNTIAEAKKESEKESEKEDRKSIPTVPFLSNRIDGVNGLQGPIGWDPTRYPPLRSEPSTTNIANFFAQNTWTPPTNLYTNTTIGNVTYSRRNTTLYVPEPTVGASYDLSAKDILDHSDIIIPDKIHTIYLPTIHDLLTYHSHKCDIIFSHLHMRTFLSKNPTGFRICGDNIIGNILIPYNKDIKFALKITNFSFTLTRLN